MKKEVSEQHMSYLSLRQLRDMHPSWSLLASKNAPFILSFLFSQFILENKRDIPEYQLIETLEHFMKSYEELADRNKTAQEYLLEWAGEEYKWLRRFYPPNQDEVHYDLTANVQKAISWIADLEEKSFIGTESRLKIVFELLAEISQKSELDPELRIQNLERQKREIEEEIQDIRQGKLKVLHPVQMKERFLQANTMALEILNDFRAVEQKFRDLNKKIRQNISSWDRGKGEFLENYFYQQNNILTSEQGKSFQSFIEFLNSQQLQEDLQTSIQYLSKIEELKALVEQSRLPEIKSDWLEGSQYIWKNIERMAEQLRHYIDDKMFREDKYIYEAIKNLESKAYLLDRDYYDESFMEVENPKLDILLPMDRKLFSSPKPVEMVNFELEYAAAQESLEQLYHYHSVSKEELLARVNKLLEEQEKLSIKELVEQYPLQYSLRELLTYFLLNEKLQIERCEEEDIEISWEKEDGISVKVKMKQAYFSKLKEE